MAGRKYISDFEIEKRVAPGGKAVPAPVYRGAYYRFSGSEADIRRLRRTLLLGVGAVLLLLVPLLLDNTQLSRTVYIVLPAVLAMAPLYLLLGAARRLGSRERVFTREHRDKTDGRLRGAAVALSLCLGSSCVGCVIRALLWGTAPGEIIGIGSLFLAFAVSLYILSRRKKAATEKLPVESALQQTDPAKNDHTGD